MVLTKGVTNCRTGCIRVIRPNSNVIINHGLEDEWGITTNVTKVEKDSFYCVDHRIAVWSGTHPDSQACRYYLVIWTEGRGRKSDAGLNRYPAVLGRKFLLTNLYLLMKRCQFYDSVHVVIDSCYLFNSKKLSYLL